MEAGQIPLGKGADTDWPPSEQASRPGALRDYYELAKPRIAALVLVTAAAGYLVGAAAFDGLVFVHMLVGIALVAAGTGAMNHVLERDVDALMNRTRDRPLPGRRISVGAASIYAGILTASGIAYLAVTVNLITAILAAATFVTYDFVYTPLKRVHSFSTVIGAVPGALPILGGWTAATGQIGAGGWALFGILFLWQLPHFLALAWLLRDEYEAAGLPMLSVGDRDGFKTRHQTLLYTVTLLPVSVLPSVLGLAGLIYFVCAVVLGGGFLWRAIQFARGVSTERAGRLFRFSILYLPLLLLALVLDKV